MTTRVFLVLHFLYALVFSFLGASCLFLSTDYHTAIPLSDINSTSDNTAERLRSEWSEKSTEASDLAVAQQRLSDGSTLVHEIVMRHRYVENETLISGRVKTRNSANVGGPDSSMDDNMNSLHTRRSDISAGSLGNLLDHENDRSGASGVVRVGIRPDVNGLLSLQIHPTGRLERHNQDSEAIKPHTNGHQNATLEVCD